MRTRNVSTSTNSDYGHYLNKEKYKYIEFKHLYFKIQKLIDKKVVLSLKYEQLKAPEIYSTLIKPITTKIIDTANTKTLHQKLNKYIPIGLSPFQTPKFGPHAGHVGFNHGSTGGENQEDGLKVSINLIYILLLLKYEYMIQSENNLLRFELLTTKANLCEILAIRMLREYKSFDRINLLFINPMKNNFFANKFMNDNLSNYYKPYFNTIELSILSKSKKFLSQPIIIQILERFYNGELIIRDYSDNGIYDDKSIQTLLDCNVNNPDDLFQTMVEEAGLINDKAPKNIINYKFNKISINKIIVRSNIVPKYQSLVINLKHICLTVLYFILIINNKKKTSIPNDSEKEQEFTQLSYFINFIELVFWCLALSLNFEFLIKIINIEYKFLKKIIWTYIDMVILFLINVTFLLRILKFFDKVSNNSYYDFFSLTSIILFPRILSIFNNYEFFHMIILSLKKMLWNMIGMFCLFISMIFGFYLCFISLTLNRSNYDIAFDMLKLFFGFTPAVWSNWTSYNTMGKIIQMCYLFLIQFIIGTILAIVLGNVFAKINQSNKEEFEYFKTINLIIYLKWGNSYYFNLDENLGFKSIQSTKKQKYLIKLTYFMNIILKVFKFPIILIIFFYEIIIKNKLYKKRNELNLKNFTFLDKDMDYYGDNDMINLYRSGVSTIYDGGYENDDSDMSILLMKSRKNSLASTTNPNMNNRKFSQIDSNSNFAVTSLQPSKSHDLPESHHNNRKRQKELVQIQSIYTLGNLRSASTDSLFIDEVLNKKYGGNDPNLNSKKNVNNYKSSSGGSGNSGSTIVGNMQPLERVKTNNSEMSKTPVAVQPQRHVHDRLISLLNINNTAEDYQYSRRRRTFELPKKSKDDLKKSKDKNDEILSKLNQLESIINRLVESKIVDEASKSVVDYDDTSNNSIIINEDYGNHESHHQPQHMTDEIYDTENIGDFEVHKYTGENQDTTLEIESGCETRRPSAGGGINSSNMYNITEVSVDDMELYVSSRRSIYDDDDDDDMNNDSIEETDEYESDETF